MRGLKRITDKQWQQVVAWLVASGAGRITHERPVPAARLTELEVPIGEEANSAVLSAENSDKAARIVELLHGQVKLQCLKGAVGPLWAKELDGEGARVCAPDGMQRVHTAVHC